MNAAVASNLKMADLVKISGADSVNVCLSKGIGAPIGSILAGHSDFIEKARRFRKMLGGGWRQAGHLAAAALTALETAESRIMADHRRAAQIARIIDEVKSDKFEAESTETNMTFIKPRGSLSAELICGMLEAEDDGSGIVVKSFVENEAVRLVTYSGIDNRDLEMFKMKLNCINKKL